MRTPPLIRLRRHHRRELWLGTLWVAVGAIAGDCLLFRLGVPRDGRLGFLAVAALTALLVRLARHRPPADTARRLDAGISSANRLEALAELGPRSDPLALALHAEADAFFSTRRLPRPWAWWTGLAALGALLALRIGLPGRLARPGAAVPVPAALPPPAPPPAASLRWLAPDPEIAATPAEIVAMTIEGRSATGFDHLVLHLTLNGVPQRPLPLAPAIGRGTQAAALLLPLAPLAGRPFDILSYYLTAERMRPPSAPGPAWAETFSPLQFVQFRGLNTDSPLDELTGGGADRGPARLLALAQRLKESQFSALRDTFLLAHDLAGAGPADRIALAQTLREGQDTAVTGAAALAGPRVPAAAAALIPGIQHELRQAAAALAEADFRAAVAPEERALAGIAQAEKILSQAAREIRPPLRPDRSDVASPRSRTAAGRLERLDREEATRAAQLAQGTAEPDALATQDRIARELQALAAEGRLPPSTLDAIRSAAASARQSAQQLGNRDPAAAMEPAARSQQALDDAVAQLEAQSRAQAAAQLAAAQRAFLRAADEARASPDSAEDAGAARDLTAATVDRLRQVAANQHESGSELAAQVLAQVADAADASGIVPELTGNAQSPATITPAEASTAASKLTDLAQHASDARAQLEDPEKMRQEARQELTQARANLDRASKDSPAAMRDLYEQAQAAAQAAQSAETKPSTPGSQPGSSQPGGSGGSKPGGSRPGGSSGPGKPGSGGSSQPGGADRLGGITWNGIDANSTDLAPLGHGPLPPPANWKPGFGYPNFYVSALDQQIGGLLSHLAAEESLPPRSQVLATSSPAEAPPAYRSAVADYFLSLARRGPPPASP